MCISVSNSGLHFSYVIDFLNSYIDGYISMPPSAVASMRVEIPGQPRKKKPRTLCELRYHTHLPCFTNGLDCVQMS